MTDQSAHLEIQLLNLQEVAVDESRILDVARSAAQSEGATGELSIVLVDAERMSELNSQFRQECGPTDVLSFSIDGLISGGARSPEAPLVIGEVIVCPEVAAKQAIDGLDAELALLVAHGILHLVGHDHDTEENAAEMRRKEFDLTGRSGASAS